jgi:hypothetical protein
VNSGEACVMVSGLSASAVREYNASGLNDLRL